MALIRLVRSRRRFEILVEFSDGINLIHGSMGAFYWGLGLVSVLYSPIRSVKF